jgi:hypothetical protein
LFQRSRLPQIPHRDLYPLFLHLLFVANENTNLLTRFKKSGDKLTTDSASRAGY